MDLNHQPRPYQGSVVRFYNDIQDRGDCQTPRKSYKTSHSGGWIVGWIVGWKKASIVLLSGQRTYAQTFAFSREAASDTNEGGEFSFGSDCRVRSRRQAPDAGWSDRGEEKSGRSTAPQGSDVGLAAGDEKAVFTHKHC